MLPDSTDEHRPDAVEEKNAFSWSLQRGTGREQQRTDSESKHSAPRIVAFILPPLSAVPELSQFLLLHSAATATADYFRLVRQRRSERKENITRAAHLLAFSHRSLHT